MRPMIKATHATPSALMTTGEASRRSGFTDDDLSDLQPPAV